MIINKDNDINGIENMLSYYDCKKGRKITSLEKLASIYREIGAFENMCLNYKRTNVQNFHCRILLFRYLLQEYFEP